MKIQFKTKLISYSLDKYSRQTHSEIVFLKRRLRNDVIRRRSSLYSLSSHSSVYFQDIGVQTGT